MNLLTLKIHFASSFEGADILLLSVAPVYEYMNGEKTEKIVGYRYGVVETNNFEKFSVKVPSTAPAITPEQLAETKVKLKVAFDNCFGRLYRTEKGGYDVSFAATDIHIINPK